MAMLHVWVSCFAIAAAILTVGGYVLLQWQRNRHRFQLMQAALESGQANFGEGPPFWLISLRLGVAVLVLGVGLMIVGAVAITLAQSVEQPGLVTLQSNTSAQVPGGSASQVAEGKKLKPEDRPKPVPNLPLERWHRAQDQQTVGLASLGCGFLIALLGIVRTIFGVFERKHFRNIKQPSA
jgi:hypothetical protein